ncbi:MAG: protein phosphatase 2C domain-containing protein [Treponema sp.]|jgi:serine/threonine protein phosphatase PrpC|nr:protein phosphatase 2C domain-containing protein [Treponema sp.]
MFIGFALKQQGASHVRNHNKPCEDACGYFENEHYHTALAVIADGHGSDKYFRSRFGSALAVETAHEVIDGFIEQTGKENRGFFNPDAKNNHERMRENLEKIEKKMVLTWREKVFEHSRANPWTEKEIAFCREKGVSIPLENDENRLVNVYGSTLIAALVAEHFWFAIQIGDGGCVVIRENGIAGIVLEEDEEQGFGITKSLCNEDAINHFRHNFGFGTILGVTVASDGVTDSFSREDYLAFNSNNLLKNFVEQPDQACVELKNYLPKLSSQGSQDDVSIAGVFNAEIARPFLPFIEQAAQKQQAVVQVRQELVQVKLEAGRLRQESDSWQKKHATVENALQDERRKLSVAEKNAETARKEWEQTRQTLEKEEKEKSGLRGVLDTISQFLGLGQATPQQIAVDAQQKYKAVQDALRDEQAKAKQFETNYQAEFKKRKEIEESEKYIRKELEQAKENVAAFAQELKKAKSKLAEAELKLSDERNKPLNQLPTPTQTQPDATVQTEASQKTSQKILSKQSSSVPNDFNNYLAQTGEMVSSKQSSQGITVVLSADFAEYKENVAKGIECFGKGENKFKENKIAEALADYQKALDFFNKAGANQSATVTAGKIEICNKKLNSAATIVEKTAKP